MKQLLTVEQVADILQVSPESVRRYLRDGLMRGLKLPQKWRVSQEELERFIRDNTEQLKEDRENK